MPLTQSIHIELDGLFTNLDSKKPAKSKPNHKVGAQSKNILATEPRRSSRNVRSVLYTIFPVIHEVHLYLIVTLARHPQTQNSVIPKHPMLTMPPLPTHLSILRDVPNHPILTMSLLSVLLRTLIRIPFHRHIRNGTSGCHG